MKRLAVAVIILGLLAGCASKSESDGRWVALERQKGVYVEEEKSVAEEVGEVAIDSAVGNILTVITQ